MYNFLHEFLSGDEFRTPEKGYDFEKFINSSSKESSTRRKLILKRRGSGDGETLALKLNIEEVSRNQIDNQNVIWVCQNRIGFSLKENTGKVREFLAVRKSGNHVEGLVNICEHDCGCFLRG